VELNSFGDDNMNNRYIGAFFLLPLPIFLFLGGIYLKYMALILSILGLHEFYKVAKMKGIHTTESIGYFLAIIYYLMLGNTFNFRVFTFYLVSCVLILLCIPVINTKYNFIDAAVTALGFIYIPVFFSFIYLVDIKLNGNKLVWLIFLSSWACDTTAYYIGRYFGKTKLCPEVSPKKTVEGSIGGFFGSIIACTLTGYIFTLQGLNINIINYVLIGALCGILGQLGDLVASSIKRYCNVKDYSNLIPGHGGILDRFDSILFASLVVYYYITIIMGV
jgi:phosphatidate cytidylyltransferase